MDGGADRLRPSSGWTATRPATICSTIVGATAQTYVVAAADIGHTIRVFEGALNGEGPAPRRRRRPTTAVVTGFPPKNTAPPTISGVGEIGSDGPTCSPGTWDRATQPISYAYQWLGDGNPIAGATGPSHPLAPTDVALAEACAVTATSAAGHATEKSDSILVTASTSSTCSGLAGAALKRCRARRPTRSRCSRCSATQRGRSPGAAAGRRARRRRSRPTSGRWPWPSAESVKASKQRAASSPGAQQDRKQRRRGRPGRRRDQHGAGAWAWGARAAAGGPAGWAGRAGAPGPGRRRTGRRPGEGEVEAVGRNAVAAVAGGVGDPVEHADPLGLGPAGRAYGGRVGARPAAELARRDEDEPVARPEEGQRAADVLARHRPVGAEGDDDEMGQDAPTRQAAEQVEGLGELAAAVGVDLEALAGEARHGEEHGRVADGQRREVGRPVDGLGPLDPAAAGDGGRRRRGRRGRRRGANRPGGGPAGGEGAGGEERRGGGRPAAGARAVDRGGGDHAAAYSPPMGKPAGAAALGAVILVGAAGAGGAVGAGPAGGGGGRVRTPAVIRVRAVAAGARSSGVSVWPNPVRSAGPP